MASRTTQSADVELAGRVALVTGGGRGIGRVIALALAEAGADVAVTSRLEGEIREVADLIERSGRRALAVTADVAERGAVERAVGEVEGRLSGAANPST